MGDLSNSAPRRSRLILAGIIGLAALLRLSTLSSKSMWLDEGLTALCAESFEFALEQCWNIGVNSPGTIFLTIIPYRLFPSDFGLRLVPALFGIATVPVLSWLVRRWCGEAGGLSAALLLTLSPLHLHFSQDARTYSVMAFCTITTTLAIDCLYERWQEGLSPRSYAFPATCFVIFSLLNLYNNYLAFIVLGFHCLWMLVLILLKSTREKLHAAVYAGLLLMTIGAGFSPWLPPVLTLYHESWVQAGLKQQRIHLEKADISGQEKLAQERLRITRNAFRRLAGYWTDGVVHSEGDRTFAVVLHIGLALVGVWLAARSKLLGTLPGIGLLAIALVYVAVTAGPLMVYAKIPLYTRHITYGYPFFLAFQAVTLGALWRKKRGAFVLVWALILFTWGQPLFNYFRTEKGGWRGAARYLEQNVQSGDLVVVATSDWPLLAYLQRWGFTIDPGRYPAILRRGDLVITVNPSSVAVIPGKRLWWVYGENGPIYDRYMTPDSLRYTSDWGFHGGHVQLYLHPPEP